jgi:hypothetical protein
MTQTTDFFDNSGIATTFINNGKNGTFTLPDGSEFKAIEGVIVGWRLSNTLYPKEYHKSDGEPPMCWSVLSGWPWADPKLQEADQSAEYAGTKCLSCEYNQAGSYRTFYENQGASEFKAACQRRVELAIVIEGVTDIQFVSVPVTSVKLFQTYCSKLRSGQHQPNGVITKVLYEQEKSAGGIKFEKMKFELVSALDVPLIVSDAWSQPAIEHVPETDDVPF